MIAQNPPATVAELFQRFRNWNLKLGDRAAQQYQIAVRMFDRFLEREATLEDLNDDTVIAFIRWLMPGRSPDTVNGKRGMLLTIWRWGAKRGWLQPPMDVPKVPRIERIPRAWTPEDVGKILSACLFAPVLRGHGEKADRIWVPRHWQAYVLVQYDTSLRMGCLLELPRDAFDSEAGTIFTPGDIQKGKADQWHRLHPQTVAILEGLPASDLLFPWPFQRKRIWQEFKLILSRAGLPYGRKDMFHRIRKTAYTQVAIAAGKDAASKHAGHKSDLSSAYLDTTQLPTVNPIDVIPRPQM